MDFWGIGGWEILLIIVIILILWGPGRIVEISRTFGKIIYKLRNITSELTTQISKEIDEQKSNDQPASSEKENH
jgi:sec-independent protein translocase protein TatA